MKKQINKFCGEKNCKLNFVHWHEEGRIKTPPEPSRIEIVKNRHGADIPVKHFDHTDPEERGDSSEMAAADIVLQELPEVTDMAEKIRAAVAGLPGQEDPSADRFQGKSPEEVRLIVMAENMQKWGERIDRHNNITLGAVTDFDIRVGNGLGTVSKQMDNFETQLGFMDRSLHGHMLDLDALTRNATQEIRDALDGEGSLHDQVDKIVNQMAALDRQVLDTREDIRKKFDEMIAGTSVAVEKLNATVLDATTGYQKRVDNAVMHTRGLTENHVLPQLDKLLKQLFQMSLDQKQHQSLTVQNTVSNIRQSLPTFVELALAAAAGGALLVSGVIIVGGAIALYSHFWG